MRYLILLLFFSLALWGCYEEELPVEEEYYYYEEEPFPPMDDETELLLGGTASFDWYSTSITYMQYSTNSSPASPVFSFLMEKSGLNYSFSLIGGETKCIAENYENSYHYSLYISVEKSANPGQYITLKYWETITGS
jgi:hypothetical protein